MSACSEEFTLMGVLAARRASNIKAQGERSEAPGEMEYNFEPRRGDT